jgi:sugar/nucleoside kinase (ribokinase family)
VTILVVGDANADLSGTLLRYPTEGDDSPLSALSWGSGGAAVNVATALALLGGRVRLFARVGTDPAATVAVSAAQRAGVDLSMVQHDEQHATGLCFAAISANGERTFFSFRGANAAFDYQPTSETCADVRWLHICGHALLEGTQRGAALALLHAARQQHVPVSLDLCLPLVRAWREEIIDLLPHLHVLFANELESTTLCAAPTPEHVAEQLTRHVATVVLKRGASGCMVATAAAQLAINGLPVDAVDTNGCGDAFIAGFLHAHLNGATLPETAQFANATGALAATRPGSADALPNRATIRTFLAQHQLDMLLRYI